MNITSTTLRKGLKRNTYTPQKLGFDNRRPFNMGLHSQNEQKPDDSPFKMSENEYWYKIGGKTVTKAQYNAHKNPVGDGPTKSTNDPDASGNKAKIQKNRSTNKASKRPTVLTKEQTKLKGQGTKITKKPPFKQKLNGKKLPKGYTKKDAKFLKKQREDVVRYEDLDAKGQAIWKKQGKPVPKKSPLEFDWKNALDNAQTGIMGAGMIPAVGNVADLVNAGISGGRAAYHKYKGNNKEALKHSGNVALNLAAAVPVAGQAVAGTRLAVKAGSKVAKGVGAVKKVKKAKEIVKRSKQANDAITKKNKEIKNSTMTINSEAKPTKNIG